MSTFEDSPAVEEFPEAEEFEMFCWLGVEAQPNKKNNASTAKKNCFFEIIPEMGAQGILK